MGKGPSAHGTFELEDAFCACVDLTELLQGQQARCLSAIADLCVHRCVCVCGVG